MSIAVTNAEKSASLFLGWPESSRAVLKFSRKSWQDFHAARRHIYKAVTYSSEGHCLTVAPTGTGKGRGVIIPNLLHYPGSVIVIDPKGENYQATARFRSEELGQRVILLDPFEQIKSDRAESDRGGLNPFDFMFRDRMSAEADATMIAEVLAAEKQGQKDPYWDNSAKAFLASLVYHVYHSYPPDRRNLGEVMNEVSRNSWWQRSFEYDTARPTLSDARDLLGNEIVQQFAQDGINAMFNLHLGGKGSIQSTAKSYLNAMTEDKIRKSLSHSSISFEDVVFDSGDRFTIFVVIPPSKLTSHSALLRLWISVLLNAIMSRRSPPPHRTLFLLDECAQLGTLPQLRSAVTLLRGYGLQVWMFFQDRSQLEELYRNDWRNLVNNCAVIQTFGHTRDMPVKEIAELHNGIEPAEIQSMGRLQQLLSIAGQRTVRSELAAYDKDGLFSGRFDTPSFHS